MDDTGAGGRHLGAQLSPADLGIKLTASAYDGVSPRYRRYPKWLWVMALLGVPGGVVGYILLRDTNAGAARSILRAGVLVQIVIWMIWAAQAVAHNSVAGGKLEPLFTVLR